MKSALIAGASGLVGGKLLQELLAASDYDRVVAISRRPLEVTHPKLVTVIADFTALERLTVDLRADDAYCCLGTTIRRAGSRENFRAVDHVAVLAFAWAARRNGVRRFLVVSSLGANAQSRVFYNRVKGEMEEALRVLDFPTLALFRPSLLLGLRKDFRLGERLTAALLWLAEPLLVGQLRPYRAIDAGVVARAMVRCALGGKEEGVRVLRSDEIERIGHFGA